MSEQERLARKAGEGLKHCAPKGAERGGCGGCPYYEKDCACEDREMVTLPSAMVEDFRNLVAAYAAAGNG